MLHITCNFKKWGINYRRENGFYRRRLHYSITQRRGFRPIAKKIEPADK